MIKVARHPIACDCADCQTLYPPDRFDVTWTLPDPGIEGAVEARGDLPIGGRRASWACKLWVVDLQGERGRLATDWPGLPGTAGAAVTLSGGRAPRIVDTIDPVLRGFTDRVPLRRRAVERLNARCMVDFGLAPADAADYIGCEHHGHGLPATTCPHLTEGEGEDAVLLYGVDGDYPDLLCPACVAGLAATRGRGPDAPTLLTVCSRCLQGTVHRHRVVAATWYGAPPGTTIS